MHSTPPGQHLETGAALMAWGNAVKRKSGIILAAVLAVMAVAAAAGFLLVRAAEDRVTEEFVARADRFSIPADWRLEDSIVRREMFLCMDTNPCPSIAKRWNAGRQLTVDDLKAISATSGFSMSVEGTCSRRPNVGGPTTVCSSSGTDGEYDYKLNVTSPGKDAGVDLVVLIVEPHN
ncbi:hypothetical protein J7I89_24470 [Arthrobacter sp. ISL-5]|nr:hypothetical protein [Arthrobacter sp. ISL-5]